MLTGTGHRTRSLIAATVCLLILATASLGQITEVPEDIAPIDAPFPMPQLQRPSFPSETFDIRDYGAQEMGENSDVKITDAVHRAIAAASENGGGTVLIPAGKWLTGPIHFRSNIHLLLAKGAEVYFSTDKNDYLPVVHYRHEGVETFNYSPLIYVSEAKNVAITGQGTLNAQGEHWWRWGRSQPRAIATKVPLSLRHFGKGAGMEGMRPNFIVFWKCEDILVEGITLNDSPMWNVHLLYSRRAIVRDVKINSLQAPNGDGVVVDSSQDVLVEYNHFKTGDDAVVIKSGFNEEGLQINIPTQNVVVRNYEARDVRTGSGGIVFGSETSGGIKNIYVHDAYFEGSDRGIRFKSERGRGNVVENIFIRDIRMKDINQQAINVNTFYTGPTARGPAPLFRNIDIRNVQIDGVPEAITLIGLPEKWLENFTLTNVTVKNARVGARFTRVKNLILNQVQIESQQRAMVATDVYELTLNDVTLKDQAEGDPLLLEGQYTGEVTLGDYPTDEVEFGDGLTPAILAAPEPQQW